MASFKLHSPERAKKIFHERISLKSEFKCTQMIKFTHTEREWKRERNAEIHCFPLLISGIRTLGKNGIENV